MKYIYKWEYIRHKICAAFMTLSNIWKKSASQTSNVKGEQVIIVKVLMYWSSKSVNICILINQILCLEILTYSQLNESYKNDLQNESICTVSPIYAHGHAV